ncbi:MAG: hypothetical protein KF852_18325 [Saprospiraceae bacterium]|nr:hypothetical protein [Saprospiraceae bacterium]
MTSLIIDTLSIQFYIFGSNKLKENIGSSYIIEKLVYKKMIPRALKEAGVAQELSLEAWRTHPETYRLDSFPEERVEVGYMGGGNALLIFREKEDALKFVKSYSRLLLAHFPGLKTAFGLLEGFQYQQGEAYKAFRRKLNENLIQNRNASAVQVLPLKHGIVEDCPWTNEAQEKTIREGNTSREISKMAWSRLSLVKDAQEALLADFDDEVGDMFTFTDELDKFGQPDDKGYIAIVHADGNGMGQCFIDCQSLADTRKLSAGVANYAIEVMEKLMTYLVSLFQGDKPKLDWKLEVEIDEDTGKRKRILPIRPLIIGGDDITFVCEGRLGVHLAEKLLDYMHQTPINGKNIHACAGVAIVHTKYPFYKAYQLTEELTKRAKKPSRGQVGGSWLHYMISTGGFSGPLEDIIADQFTVAGAGRGKLKSGPYRVDGKAATLPLLHTGMKVFATQWPRNKVKDLRDALRRDDAHQNYFLTEMDARKLSLPNNGKALWEKGKTPYYDMIELLDFYPENLLP